MEWNLYSLKLLGEGKVYAGDQNLEKIKDLVYPIIMIIRQEKEGIYDYKVASADIVIQKSDGTELLRLSAEAFLNEAEALLSAINEKPAGERSFPVARTQAFMDKIYCSTLKAGSSDKTDIRIILHDQRTKINNEMGFSIKSQLGGDSTLLNASGATNFTYLVDGYDFSDEEIEQINAIDTRTKIIDRIERIWQKGGTLVFCQVENSTRSATISQCSTVIWLRLLHNFWLNNSGRANAHLRVLFLLLPKQILSAMMLMT